MRRHVRRLPVVLDVPPEIASGANARALADEAITLLTIERYRRQTPSATAAARLLRVGHVEFLEICGAHGVAVLRYDADDFRRELRETRDHGQ